VEALEEMSRRYTLENTEALVAEGKVSAVWGGSSWEAPLVYACGHVPIGFAELWRHGSKEAEAVGENVFQVPPEFCSMIKAIIGRLHLRRESRIKKILFFGGYCEPAIVFELAKKDGYELFTIEGLTAFKEEEKRPEVIAFLVKELERTAVWLTGKPVDQDRLRAQIQLKNRVLGKIRRILELRLKAPFHLTAIPTMRVMAGSNHFFGNAERYLEVLDLLIRELQAATRVAEERSYIPLILAGGAMGGPGLINAIEESNGVIVGWIMTSTTDYREDVPPLEALAHYLFDSQRKGELGEGAGTSCTNRRVKVEELVHQTGARGIISSFTGGCPYGSIVQQFERTYFKKIGIPTVALESTVHKEPPTEEQIMKVKTFIEMLS
jgi:benzoyl-CoA reductase/2-hydroxyglutaryl-CoA dehydratase subunit BcrC/BadD/HgdB